MTIIEVSTCVVLGASPSKAQYEALGVTPAASTIIRVCGGWNAAKEQAGLQTNTSTGSRMADQPSDVALPKDVRWGELSANQRWHDRPAEQNAESLDCGLAVLPGYWGVVRAAVPSWKLPK